MGKRYDLVTIGGGLGGAAMAKVMAEAGRSVLVLERTTAFRDRVRGEVLTPWGCGDAERLGLLEPILAFANRVPTWGIYVNGQRMISLDTAAAGTSGYPILCYPHVRMQEAVLDAARTAGAEVVRGARVTGVEPGPAARVRFERGGEKDEVEAGFVVAADGRQSAVRGWLGFPVERDPERRLFGGVLLSGVDAPADEIYSTFQPELGRMAYAFPQGAGWVRAYIGHAQGDAEMRRFQGSGDVARFLAAAIDIGVPAAFYANAEVEGPLASFDATDEWVEHPYRDGVALIGDAAATSDPTWGQGMSITLRDVRLLSAALLANDDRDAAGHAYAEAHRRDHEPVHRADSWYTQMLLATGEEADAARARAVPRLLEDPSRMPRTPFAGPEAAADEHARRRFFGEI